jgi:hypothetical protein
LKKLKKLYECDDREVAKEARSLKQAQLYGHEALHEQMVENVDFSRDVMEDLVVSEKFEEEKGVSDLDVGESSSGRSLSRKEWVVEGIESLDSPTDEEVAEWVFEQDGVEQDVVFDLIDGLCREGEAMRKRDGSLRVL